MCLCKYNGTGKRAAGGWRVVLHQVRLQACSFLLSTGCSPTTPATRGPRHPLQGPPAGSGTPERCLREVDAYPGAPPDTRLPGAPADSPSWPRAPGESEREEGLQAEQRIYSTSLKDPGFLIPLTPNYNCSVCSGWCLEAWKPILCANPRQEPTRQGPGRLYLKMSCPPGPFWAPRSQLYPSLGGTCLRPTQCPTMSCECLPVVADAWEQGRGTEAGVGQVNKS